MSNADAVFVGKVIKHKAYVALENEYVDLIQYTSEFKKYWQLGFSPLVGKDGILPVPDIYQDNAIGRAHVKPTNFSDKTFSSTANAWMFWAIGSGDVIPTSNSFLIYCVDHNRNCCLLAYLDSGIIDSHEKLKDHEFRKHIRNRAEEFFKAYGSFAMDKDECECLFTEKWLLKSLSE